MNKTVAAIVAGATIAVAATSGVPEASAATRDNSAPGWVYSVRILHGARWLHDCPTEDSHGCVWNAAYQGNGRGSAFIAPRGSAPVRLRVTSEGFLVTDRGRATTTRAYVMGRRHILAEVDGRVRYRNHRWYVVAQRG